MSPPPRVIPPKTLVRMVLMDPPLCPGARGHSGGRPLGPHARHVRGGRSGARKRLAFPSNHKRIGNTSSDEEETFSSLLNSRCGADAGSLHLRHNLFYLRLSTPAESRRPTDKWITISFRWFGARRSLSTKVAARRSRLTPIRWCKRHGRRQRR